MAKATETVLEAARRLHFSWPHGHKSRFKALQDDTLLDSSPLA